MKAKNELLRKVVRPSKEEIQEGMKRILIEQLQKRRFLKFNTQKSSIANFPKRRQACN